MIFESYWKWKFNYECVVFSRLDSKMHMWQNFGDGF